MCEVGDVDWLGTALAPDCEWTCDGIALASDCEADGRRLQRGCDEMLASLELWLDGDRFELSFRCALESKVKSVKKY